MFLLLAKPQEVQSVLAKMTKLYFPFLDFFPQEQHWHVLTQIAHTAKLWEGNLAPESVPFEKLLELHQLIDISPANLPKNIAKAVAVHALLSDQLPQFYVIGWKDSPRGTYLWDTGNPVCSIAPFQKYNNFRSPIGDLLTALIIETPWTHPILKDQVKPKSLTHGTQF